MHIDYEKFLLVLDISLQATGTLNDVSPRQVESVLERNSISFVLSYVFDFLSAAIGKEVNICRPAKLCLFHQLMKFSILPYHWSEKEMSKKQLAAGDTCW